MAETEALREAIDLALKGEWDAAHRLVQNVESESAAWIHAVLHKIEGDTGNARYWYRRANRPFTDTDPTEELAQIKAQL